VTPRDKLRASLRANSEHVRQWPAWLRAAISTAEVFAPNQKGTEGNGNMNRLKIGDCVRISDYAHIYTIQRFIGACAVVLDAFGNALELPIVRMTLVEGNMSTVKSHVTVGSYLIPSKTGWHRARWPGYSTWACVLVTVTGAEASVYDPGTSRWRPLTDILEWGASIEDTEAEIECLRTELRLANDAITNLRAAVDTLTTILDEVAR